jgi:hypothetical protein
MTVGKRDIDESFLNSHASVKREQELMRVEKREFAHESFLNSLMPRLNENKS